EASPAMVFGGSTVSTSATFAARTVTVHDSLAANRPAGSSVYVVGPPDDVAVCAPLVAHWIANQSPEIVTGSLKVIVMSLSRATPVAPACGDVVLIDGAASPTTWFWGLPAFGPVKSVALSPVSWVPPTLR